MSASLQERYFGAAALDQSCKSGCMRGIQRFAGQMTWMNAVIRKLARKHKPQARMMS